MPATWQGLYIGAISSAIMILLVVNVRPVFNMLNLDAQTSDIAEGYLDAFAWGIPFMLLMVALRVSPTAWATPG